MKSVSVSPAVSVVIPVYNVAPWLGECLDSIRNQTLDDIEIICIDDGSTDDSADILQRYASADSRIRVIRQDNSGISETRNVGVRASSGKYLFFMDSDDVLESTALELCVKNMEDRELEFVCFNAVSFGEDNESAKIAGVENRIYFRRSLEEDRLYTGRELFAELTAASSYISPVWTCMLARESFLEHDLWFHSGIIHEDEPWMFKVMVNLSRCGCINRILYRRRIRAGSITQIPVSFKNAYGMFVGFGSVQRELILNPELFREDDYAQTMTAFTQKLQESAVKKFCSCSDQEKLKRRELDPEERLEFEQAVTYPAVLMDRLEIQTAQQQELQKNYDSLVREKTALANENARLKKQVLQLKADKKKLNKRIRNFKTSRSYRLGLAITWLPRKLKLFFRKPADVSEKNIIKILPSEVSGSHIVYRYELSGPWSSYFNTNNEFEITYPFDLETIPESIRILPFLALVLPVSWVCGGQIEMPECDEDFCNCLDDVKDAYRKMYPMLSFGGTLITKRVKNDRLSAGDREKLVCFSGGVDALNTTIGHIEEKPVLAAIWGADVPFGDENGWKPVDELIRTDAETLGLERITIRSSFRKMLPEGRLGSLVEASGDGWWHGFQHGIGILAHMAPAAWALNADTVYIASSYTSEDVYTCASDPTIDNHVRFCSCRVIHDGYEQDRQDKIRRIVGYSGDNGKAFPLHVCWEKRGGDNCCHCEKCWRTMLGIYVEGGDPKAYGFKEFDGLSRLSSDLEKNYSQFKTGTAVNFTPIQKRLREKMPETDVPQELAWLYHTDLHRLEDGTLRLHNSEVAEPVYLLGTPEHNNMGDHLIAEEEKRFLKTLLPDRCVIEISENELIRRKYRQLEDIPPYMPVFLLGGGNLGTIWPLPEKVRREIIRRLDKNPVIIFPQSISFSEDEAGRSSLEEAEIVYSGDNILLCCREEVSYTFARSHFRCKTILTPDIVMWEAKEASRPTERFGALMLLRSDREQNLNEADALEIQALLVDKFRCIETADMVRGPGFVSEEDRPGRIEELISLLSSVECVVTDRLHAMILCAVTGTPCVALGNGYHKVESCGEWLKDLGYIRFIHDLRELEQAVDSVCSCRTRVYPEAEMQSRFSVLTQYIEDLGKGGRESDL